MTNRFYRISEMQPHWHHRCILVIERKEIMFNGSAKERRLGWPSPPSSQIYTVLAESVISIHEVDLGFPRTSILMAPCSQVDSR
jgi:hypothetical protein